MHFCVTSVAYPNKHLTLRHNIVENYSHQRTSYIIIAIFHFIARHRVYVNSVPTVKENECCKIWACQKCESCNCSVETVYSTVINWAVNNNACWKKRMSSNMRKKRVTALVIISNSLMRPTHKHFSQIRSNLQ